MGSSLPLLQLQLVLQNDLIEQKPSWSPRGLKEPATVERSFSLLKLNGVFDRISGILLGKHELFNDMGTGRKPYEILLEVLDGQKIPFLAEFDSCHTHPMITLPIGCFVELDATNKSVTILDSI
ncbi:hypothetical protein [Thiospirochaeta perfilievii]|uniref:hypothetical protein n=1 Tax=Thiospirochaeta perfilievii TaxID=252967 RepID=UPI001CA9AE38|nr:hypothetical protein [Thiospirochaeta perfilievii]